jgi:pyruvate formate lyase activating enzyme
MTYGKPCVVFTDPLEKNPLYHVDPGQQAIGIGTAGCNLSCTYCQNWAFSQVGPWQTDNMDLSPKGLVEKVRERGLRWITFSYTEPVAYYEYALAAARLAQDAGIRVAVVTAGYICKEPLHELIRYSDAFSVTLKGYSNQFYEKTIGCPLEAVWDTIVEIAHAGKWMEIVNLVVPTLNDDLEGIRSIARATTKLNPDIPLHFLRFAPAYRLKHLPPTPVKTLEQARETALDVGLRYVYLSNLPGHDQANTCCPSCGSRLIERVGFNVLNCRIQNGHCPDCGTAIPGMWS